LSIIPKHTKIEEVNYSYKLKLNFDKYVDYYKNQLKEILKVEKQEWGTLLDSETELEFSIELLRGESDQETGKSLNLEKYLNINYDADDFVSLCDENESGVPLKIPHLKYSTIFVNKADSEILNIIIEKWINDNKDQYQLIFNLISGKKVETDLIDAFEYFNNDKITAITPNYEKKFLLDNEKILSLQAKIFFNISIETNTKEFNSLRYLSDSSINKIIGAAQ
jgi:hypothetical protein